MKYHLAQINIAKLKYPIDDPRLDDFNNNLDQVNAAAEKATGFVWRLKDESGNNTADQTFGSDYIVNMSVWESVDALKNYMASDPHAPIMRRRREWFDRMDAAHLAFWWIPIGHEPTPGEGKDKLSMLDELGPTADAFTFSRSFDPPR